MTRSQWKWPFFSIALAKRLDRFFIKRKFTKLANRTFARGSTLIPVLVTHLKKLQIYNGKRFIRRRLKYRMIGFKFGEFVPTRIGAVYKAKQAKKKKKAK